MQFVQVSMIKTIFFTLIPAPDKVPQKCFGELRKKARLLA